ncbi:MAG: serine/threonine-protein kinase [Nocardioides sp.]
MSVGHPAPGERLGPYRIGRRLGGGGMGVVFEATDESLGRQVAVKVISPHLAEDPGFRARFAREARAQASLESAHVVTVHAYGEADGRLYLATQLVPGGDLGTLLETGGACPLPTALDVVAQVAAGLADAHRAGLVHRDIKPANVLLRERDGHLVAYLADFGIARRVSGEPTRTRAHAAGTPAFMAPELHTGGRAGVASDVYALGCLLWTALTGAAPYAGTSDYAVAVAHLEHAVPQLDAGTPLRDATDAVLRRALAKRPDDRYPSADAMRADLLAALALPDAPVVRRGLRPRGGTLAAVVAGAVLLGGGVAWAATRDAQADHHAQHAQADQDRAAASVGEALAGTGGLSLAEAGCVAHRLVAHVGVDRLRAAGVLDDRLRFVDARLPASSPERRALRSAVEACVG